MDYETKFSEHPIIGAKVVVSRPDLKNKIEFIFLPFFIRHCTNPFLVLFVTHVKYYMSSQNVAGFRAAKLRLEILNIMIIVIIIIQNRAVWLTYLVCSISHCVLAPKGIFLNARNVHK